jgi:PAS domain S-box-containing protein
MLLHERLRRIAGVLGACCAVFGAIALIGWLRDANPFAFLQLNAAPMKPGAAFCLILTGLSLCLQLQANVIVRRFGIACAAIALIFTLATLAKKWFQIDLGLDRIFVQGGAALGSRMSTHSAITLSGIALAQIFLSQQRNRRKWPVSAWLSNLAIGISAASLIASEFATSVALTRPLRLSSHLSIALLLLALGTLLARPDDRHLQVLFARSMAGMLARRLLLGVAIVPVVFSVVLAILVRQELITLADGVVLFVFAIIVTGFGLALFSVEAAAGIGESREEAEQARLALTAQLQEQAAQLQETVGLRTRELREANASLRTAAESNALLAMVAQNSTNGVMITDAEGRTKWVNAAFTRLTGFELDHIKGRKPGELLQGPDTNPETVARLREAVRNGQPCKVEILNYTRARTPFWQIVDMQPVRDPAGRLINFVANQTDITSQRADKLHLEHLNQRFELAVRAADLGVWELDVPGQRLTWDQRTLENYGLRADQFKGKFTDWTDRLHPEEREAVIARVANLKRERNHYEHEYRIIRASDGAERRILSCAIVQRDAQGKPLRVTGTDRDVTADREAKHQVNALNERLRLALQSSKYGVWEFDVVTGRRNWDDRVLELFGMTRSEFDPNRSMWLERIHPDDRPIANENMLRVLAGERAEYTINYRIIRPDGSIRHAESHGYLQRDAAGRPLRLVGLSRDITDQKHMAQALDLAEQRWQLAIEGTNDSVWDWDIPSGRIYHDERWARMLGYREGELENTSEGWKRLVHPDDLPDNEAAMQAHLAERLPFYQHEVRLRARDGTWRWLLDRGKVVRRSASGEPLRMVGTHTDITAGKQLEQRLRKSEQLASEVSRLAQIGGWEIDLSSQRVTWTDGTRRIHEVDDSFQPTIDSIWQFFPLEARTTVQSAINELTPASPSFDIQVSLLTARGSRRWVRMLGRGEFHRGTTSTVHGAIQDVTAQHESLETRRQLETQLFQAQKMETLGTLAGGIAHDFNNLLTGIIGYHELAADSMEEDHPARSCLIEARNASLRARELVDRILTFGRQSGGPAHDPIDLTAVIEEARRFLRATLPSNITIEVFFAPHCSHVLADATQLHQVLLNLGSNAAHAMRQHGGLLRIALEPTEVSPDLALTLGSTTASSYIRLSVSDTGHGMDEATRRRIFDPFFTTKNTREGTGLGLAVVHGIVRSHHGAIDVESIVGKGSTFHIYLPAAAVESEPESEPAETAPRGGGEFICVVDDEEVVGTCTKLVLENKGYRTLIFKSGEECLADLESNPSRCSVLVTDQTMPGMQGAELAAALRRLAPDMPIVIMSGYFSKISPQALDELGQVELLAKPFTTEELLHAVHRALSSTAKVG